MMKRGGMINNLPLSCVALLSLIVVERSHAFVAPSAATQSALFRRSTGGQPLQTATAPVIDKVSNDKDGDFEEEPVDDSQEQFNWFKAWYPLVPTEILNPEEPHKFQLLGMDIVVWKDAQMDSNPEFGPKPKKGKRTGGQWRAFVDECPHRKVPLSEGRIENDGTLLCSYHAWRFNGEGELVDAPQLDPDTSSLKRIQSNPKSQCNSFPTQVVDGLLYVWPEAGEDARLESALKPVKSYAMQDIDEDRMWYGPWNFRELPYGADYFIENVVDSAHVQVSHHNVVGSRYADQRMTMKTVKEVSKEGFAIQNFSPVVGGNNTAITTFHAPNLVAIETSFGTARQTLELHVSPSRPGFSNHIGRMVICKDESGAMPKLLRQFTLPMPTWLNHVAASFFLNQDALFLHHQERYLAKTGNYASYKRSNDAESSADHYTKAVLPIETDKGVVNFRNWIRLLAGGHIPYKFNPTMPPASNEVVFDVWNAHTKYCQYCQTALKRLKKVRFAAFFAATCLAVVRPMTNKALNLASVLLTAATGLVLNKFIGLFYRYEFSHAHND